MKRSKQKVVNRRVRRSKKEKFWTGSGKFFLVLIFLYALILGINEIVSIGKHQEKNFNAEIIEITGNDILSDESIKKLCNYDFNQKDKSQIDIEAIAEALMQSDFIKGVSVTKRLPRTLNITIEERKPIAFIYGRGLNLIDAEGYLIPVPKIQRSWDLPFISGISESLGKLGEQTISKQAWQAINLISHLNQSENSMINLVSEVNMINKKFFEIVMVKYGAEIRINRTEYEKELYVLQNYIKSYLDWSDLAMIDYIDLRFKDQLIVKKKT